MSKNRLTTKYSTALFVGGGVRLTNVRMIVVSKYAPSVMIDSMQVIGWVGAISFSICGIPQAWLCYKSKNAIGLSGYYLLLWLIGELCTIVYVVPTGNMPLIFNYIFNLLVLIIILRYKLFPRNVKDESSKR